MLDRVQFRQQINSALIFATIIAFICNPFYTLVVAVAYIAMWTSKDIRKLKIFRVSCIIIILICGFYCYIQEYYAIFDDSSLIDYIFFFSPLKMAFTCFLALVQTYLPIAFGIDMFFIQDEKKKQDKRLTTAKKLDCENRGHIFVAGTTGSGKTVALLQYAEDSIQKGEPLYILSGKASGNDSFSFLSQVRLLCEKYDRPLYIVSANADIMDRQPYNPFANMSVTEFADAITSACEFSEPHYKYATVVAIKSIGEALAKAKAAFSLERLLTLWNYERFMQYVSELNGQRKLTQDDMSKYSALEDLFEAAAMSRSRFLNLTLGEGKEVFGKNENDSIFAAKARKQGAVLFVDLDAFKYSDFTKSLGRFFAVDMKNLISTETETSTNKRIILDELGAYIGSAESLLPLFSQSRAYGYQIIAATQSLADIDSIDETLTERLLENCNQYVILQLNSAKDAERISNLIGTRLSIETTRKTDGALLSGKFEGTKKVVDTYIVNPNQIKRLRKLQAILYQKDNPNYVYVIDRLKFVDVERN